jgi:periplasmic protein TonB
MNLLSFFLASLALHGAVIALPIRFAAERQEEPVPVKLYVEGPQWPGDIVAEPSPRRPEIKPPKPARAAQTVKTNRREKPPKIPKAGGNVAPSQPRLLPNRPASPDGGYLQPIEEPVTPPTPHSQAANATTQQAPSVPGSADALKILKATLNPAPNLSPDRQAIAPKPDTGKPRQSEPLSAARYAYNPPPEYPESAKKAGWEGTVLLQVLIDPRGMPERIDIDHSSGFDVLDEAARQSVAKWRFHPAHSGERQIPSTVRIPIVFRLVDATK